MAIEYKRMQQRVGTYAQYEQYKDSILPNEFVAVTSGSPDTDDGSALYFKNGTGEPKLIVDGDKLASELQNLDIGTEKIDEAETHVLNRINICETNVKNSISNSEASLSGSITLSANTVLEQVETTQSTISGDISTAKNDISGFIDGAKDDLSASIGTAKSDILNDGIATRNAALAYTNDIKSSISTTEKILQDSTSSSVNDAKIDILQRLGTPEYNTVSDDISQSTTEILNKLGTSTTSIDTQLSFMKSNLSNEILSAQNTVLTEITNSETAVINKIDDSKAAILTEIKSVREEFEDKHDILLYEMQKIKNEILRVFSALADELAVGDGSVAGRSVLITRGSISQSYAGIVTREE